MLYIKIDADNNPVNHPVSGDNLKEVLEVAYIDNAVLKKHGYARFEFTELPETGAATRTTDYYMDADGVFHDRLDVREFTQEELLDRYIRARRSHLLAACDWTQSVDSPLSDAKKAEWATYRQALRDLTSEFPEVQSAADVVWPTEPTSE